MLFINLLITLIASLSITFFLIKFQKNLNLYADINHRSTHKTRTPNSGGIAIIFSFLFAMLLFDIDVNIGVIFSIITIFFGGLYDDKFGVSSKQKIFLVFIVSNILFFNGFSLNHLGVYFGYSIDISGIVSYLFLAFVLIGFVNSVNLIDGLDGLSSVVGIIMLSSFAYLGFKYNDAFLLYIPLAYIMSILGFLYFNWSPAKIFMGDSGSLSLGLIVAIVAIYAINKHYITLVTVLMLGALPMLDTFLVMTRRIASGVSPFKADKLHVHHIIHKQQAKNTKRTVLILGLMQLVFTYIGLGFKIKDDSVIIVLFTMLFVLFYYLLMSGRSDNV